MFFSLVFLVGCNTLLSKDRNLTDKQWIDDIEFLNSEITRSHPDPYRFVTKDKWSKFVETLIKEVPKLSDIEITMRISELLSLIQDGHTNMNITSSIALVNKTSYDEVLMFPIMYDWFEYELIKEINNTEFDKFIIDLRKNSGGSMGSTDYIITRLKSQTDILNKAKVYVFTS